MYKPMEEFTIQLKQLKEGFEFSADSEKALKRHKIWKKDQERAQREVDFLAAAQADKEQNKSIIPKGSVKSLQKLKDDFFDPFLNRQTVSTQETVSEYRARIAAEKAKADAQARSNTTSVQKSDKTGSFVDQNLNNFNPEDEEFRRKQKFAPINLLSKPGDSSKPKSVNISTAPFSTPNLKLPARDLSGTIASTISPPYVAVGGNRPLRNVPSPDEVYRKRSNPAAMPKKADNMTTGFSDILNRSKFEDPIALSDADIEVDNSPVYSDNKYAKINKMQVALPTPRDPNRVTHYLDRNIGDSTTALRHNIALKRNADKKQALKSAVPNNISKSESEYEKNKSLQDIIFAGQTRSKGNKMAIKKEDKKTKTSYISEADVFKKQVDLCRNAIYNEDFSSILGGAVGTIAMIAPEDEQE